MGVPPIGGFSSAVTTLRDVPGNGATVQEELDRLVVGGLPGVFAYTEDASRTPTFHTAGAANLASGSIMSPEMHYRVGSTTKTFTAVIVLQLVAEGRLTLDDLVQRHVPDLPIPNGDRLTIEHLLRMRSGLFDFEDDASLLGDLDAHLRPVSLDCVIELALRGPTRFEPSERYEYCNSNYCLLEVVIERITGQLLGAELSERIFGPLRLQHTSYPEEDDLSLPEPYIRGYELTDEGWQECSHVFFGRGDGAIVSTAVDVTRFFRALLVDRILVPGDLLKEMMTVLPDDPAPAELYGLGLFRDDLPNGPVWGHSGGGFGYGHAPFVRLDNKRIAIVMRNASFGFRQSHTEGLANQLSFTPEFRSSLYT